MKVRCTICRQHLPTLKTLKSHYLTDHSKIQIVKELLKSNALNATPGLLTKSKRRKNQYKTIRLHENVQITYTDDMIVIEDETSTDNLIELTVSEPLHDKAKDCDKSVSKRRSKKSRKSKSSFCIGIRKIVEAPKSLDEHSGEFYECHCMEKSCLKASSDTESCSDTGKAFYCKSCGNGYQTMAELTTHETSHLWNRSLNVANCRDSVEQRLIRVYVCHICGAEFICKEVLLGHLMFHFEQQTFENILDMEQDYNMYAFCNTNFSSGDYYSDINNILFFLTYPYNHYYSRNMFTKVICDICYQEFYICDYERHLKIAHLLR